jgi:hypothetical protein
MACVLSPTKLIISIPQISIVIGSIIEANARDSSCGIGII